MKKKTKDATFQSLSKPHFLNINVQIFFMEIGKILYLTDLLLTQDFFFEVDDTGKKGSHASSTFLLPYGCEN